VGVRGENLSIGAQIESLEQRLDPMMVSFSLIQAGSPHSFDFFEDSVGANIAPRLLIPKANGIFCDFAAIPGPKRDPTTI
jgi:hypothetical protein